MMKLKHLVYDPLEAVEEILQHWEYDQGTVRFFRGSANMVYFFEGNGREYVLRLSHAEENSYKEILGEIDLLLYLAKEEYPANWPIVSRNGRYIEQAQTERGDYYGVVFTREKGVYQDWEMTDERFEWWGEALAKLHCLTQRYRPTRPGFLGEAGTMEYGRKDWRQILQEIREILVQSPMETEAFIELERVQEWLESLPITDQNYGLIHYDFGEDNVLFDAQANQLHVIDFDDSMYHWYVLDLAIVLAEMVDRDKSSLGKMKAFLRGYTLKKPLSQAELDQIPDFLRFARLFKFARLVRSLGDPDFSENPDWLPGVEEKLSRICDELREGFSQPQQFRVLELGQIV